MPNLVTIKTSESARRMLKLISAHTDETQYQVMERLLRTEIARKQYRLDAKSSKALEKKQHARD